MTQDLAEKFAPHHDVVQQAAQRALADRIDPAKITNFAQATQAAGVPAPVSATASLTFAVLYGVVKCNPHGNVWKFDEDVWGVGAAAIQSVGLLYTAYNSWDAFYENTTAFHCQGIAEAGGIFQINFFNKDATPIGQFNGAAGGVAVFEAGGAGHWKKV